MESMHLTEDDITQFQTLYQKHFGEEISRERAHEEGIKLVRLMQLILKPMTKADAKRLQERCKNDKKRR